MKFMYTKRLVFLNSHSKAMVVNEWRGKNIDKD